MDLTYEQRVSTRFCIAVTINQVKKAIEKNGRTDFLQDMLKEYEDLMEVFKETI